MGPTLLSLGETPQMSLHKTKLPIYSLGKNTNRIPCYMCEKNIKIQWGKYYKDMNPIVNKL